jgi:hypothetical protein
MEQSQSSKRPRRETVEEPPREESHVVSCLICHESLVLPVRPLFKCCHSTCPYRVCFGCLRNYFMLDTRQSFRTRNGTFYAKCLLCDELIDVRLPEDRLYEHDVYLMMVLDNIMGKQSLKCRQCDNTYPSQTELLRHVKHECSMTTIYCSWCNAPVPRKDLVQHVSQCESAESCTWCKNNIIYRHCKTRHQNTCSLRKFRCLICSKMLTLENLEQHVSLHTIAIQDSFKYVVVPVPNNDIV